MNLRQYLAVAFLILSTGCADSETGPRVEGDTEAATSVVETARFTDSPDSVVVKLTEAAATKFREFLATQPGKHIRLSVIGGGSTGYQYDLQLDDSISESDRIDRSHGFVLVVDPRSSIFVDGATIDWKTLSDGRSGFEFDNPNAVKK